MNCRSAESLFSSYIEDEISQEERRHLEAHFMGCRRCSVALRDLRATMSILQREALLVQPSAHFDEDVFAKIRSGEGLRPSAWELVKELLSPIRLRPALMAGAGVSAMVVAFAISPMGQTVFHPTAATLTASRGPASSAPSLSQPSISAPSPAPAAVVADRMAAPDSRTASPVRSGSVVASVPRASSATRDSIVDGAAPTQRYNDEIINDQFYLDRGSPGQDPSVVPVNTSQDDGVFIVF